ADHDAKKRDPGYEIAERADGQIEIAAPRKDAQEQPGKNKGEHIGHAVPARADIAVNAEDERIEIVQVIGEHRATRCSTILLQRAIDRLRCSDGALSPFGRMSRRQSAVATTRPRAMTRRSSAASS